MKAAAFQPDVKAEAQARPSSNCCLEECPILREERILFLT